LNPRFLPGIKGLGPAVEDKFISKFWYFPSYSFKLGLIFALIGLSMAL
jgi:hypothetical protein